MNARLPGLAVIAMLPGACVPAGPPDHAGQGARPMLRPALMTLLQRGSIDDLVHVEAVLAGMHGDPPGGTAIRPAALAEASATGRTALYRLPVDGRIVMRFGELSDAGIRSRGLTFAVPASASVVAPAGGVVRYAQVFRGYGGTVIVDHGAGWTSLLTGLGTLAVAPGGGVRRGMALGTAGGGASPRITVELRRRGEPVDVAAMIR